MNYYELSLIFQNRDSSTYIVKRIYIKSNEAIGWIQEKITLGTMKFKQF